MVKFGYTVLRDETIDFDRQDMRMAQYLLSQEPSIRLCIGCGSCTGTCTTGHFTDFNIRRIHTLVLRGEIRKLKPELQKCMFCGKCQLVCPRGVNLRNVILTINKAIEQIG
jgi:heterodisulfide reductase subunit C